MILVIAEKPSVARDIAAVIGANESVDGVLRGNGYIVTSARGHLVRLKMPQEYDAKYEKWNISDLPIIPDFEFVPIEDAADVLERLTALMNSGEVTEIIEATDAGREGECIFRYIYNYIGCKKPFKRLWISSMTDEAIRAGFADLRPAAEYDDMFAAGLTRAKIDWLWGMNMTRLYTKHLGTLCSVGRVQTAVVNMIVQRDAEIEQFTKRPYFKLKLPNGAEWYDERGDSFSTRAEAETVKATLHYDDKVQVLEKEIGADVDMLDSFGIFKDGYSVEGWYFENSPKRIENLHVSEGCDVYAKWQTAEYITVTIDRSYLGEDAETYEIPLDMTGAGTLKLPKADDKDDIYNSVFGCTYGYSDKKQSGEFGKIKYFGETECKFKKDTTLYRVLNEYGGGAGTQENPFIISYYDQLIRLSEKKASGYFIQTADIKFPPNAERKPIDTKTVGRGYENKSYNFFCYDGQGFTIKGLSGEGGLFGTIAGASVQNVVIDGANIKAGKYKNVGVLCNSVKSYSFKSADGERDFSMGNTKFTNCTVKNSKIDGTGAANVGGLVGYGGIITYCRAEQISVNGGDNAGGIVGNACIVNGSLANGITASGEIKSAGGIAGTAYGTEIFDNGSKSYLSGGSIIGCGVRTFSAKATNSGGIVGTATADTGSAYIKSCYAANLYLNGTNNGGIAGADGTHKPHRVVYCLVDSTNGYAVIGGAKVRSISKRMVLAVPADSGLTVDGVLSVLNAAGSGFDKWERSDDKNDGYPYPASVILP